MILIFNDFIIKSNGEFRGIFIFSSLEQTHPTFPFTNRKKATEEGVGSHQHRVLCGILTRVLRSQSGITSLCAIPATGCGSTRNELEREKECMRKTPCLTGIWIQISGIRGVTQTLLCVGANSTAQLRIHTLFSQT